MSITLNSGKVTLVLDDVNVNDSTSWKVVQQENYRPSRSAFILNAFKKRFPKHAQAVKDYDMLTKLSSRSKIINEWLVGATSEYVLDVQVPQYLGELVDPKEYKKASEVLNELNNNAAKRSLEEQAVVREYKASMKKIEEKYDKLNTPLLKDKIVKILSLNSNSLPISLQLMIENYTPSVTSGSPDKRTYGRELLTSFKISLLKYFSEKDNKDVDLEEFLKEISEK